MPVLLKRNKVHLVLAALLAFIIMALLPGLARAEAVMTAGPDTVTEQAGFDQEFTLTLEGDQFRETVSAEYINLGGDFENLSIDSVAYKDSTTVTARVYGDLSYSTGQGTITIDGGALAGGNDAAAAVEVLKSADQGPVLHLEFENNLNDSSGNGNHGVAIEAAQYTDGVMGRAALFPGVDSGDIWGVKVPTSQSLEFNEEVTVSFYARLDSERGIVGNGTSKDKGYHSFFRRDGDNTFVFLLYTDDKEFDTFQVTDNPLSYAVGEWMRITVVVSADNVVVYRNKQVVMEEALSQPVDFSASNDKDLIIGAFDNLLSWYRLGCHR